MVPARKQRFRAGRLRRYLSRRYDPCRSSMYLPICGSVGSLFRTSRIAPSGAVFPRPIMFASTALTIGAANEVPAQRAQPVVFGTQLLVFGGAFGTG